MPYTPAHAVVALLARRAGLPPAAVAAGAMAPDLPLFVMARRQRQTHEAWAVLTLDPALALGLLAGWELLIRPALVALAPDAVRARLPQAAGRPALPRFSGRLLAGLVAGTASHVVWDSFTHPGRRGTRLVPLLERSMARRPVAAWLQEASSAVGLAVLAGAAIRGRGSTPLGPAASSPLGVARRPLVLVAVLLVALSGVRSAWGSGDRVVRTLTVPLSAGTVLLAAIGAVLPVLERRRSRDTPGTSPALAPSAGST
ncbi:DUF4184 family protein [Amnibacterium sp. CER49]|uniref:DUF4184 family protein n=1 Tax=Amnibacterium sp. CER49 TaxID=3039161 RepID=UPI00244954A6|nr:DUF4184 family protein [Amnibacterium sp. CER49]MDH2444950.1 DUF4184 family protein [Amnibacterium sp. CER49]